MYKYKGLKWITNLGTDSARAAEPLLPRGAHIGVPKETSMYIVGELVKMECSGLYLEEDLSAGSLDPFWIAYSKASPYYQS